MKKSLMLLSIFTLISLFLVACGGQGAAAPAGEAVEPATLPETINVETAASLQGRDDVVFIDVREQWEYDEGHIPGITHIPMGEIQSRLDEIPSDKTVILTCRSGNRSGQVFNFLQGQGYENVHNMSGGILAWQAAGYAVEQ